MKKLTVSLMILLCASSVACASSFDVDNKTFSLVNEDNICQLVDQSTSRKYNLKIPWICKVHRGTDGQVRVHKNDGRSYFLVENSTPHPDLPNDCKTQLQAVMIDGNAIKLSEHIDTVASCPPFQWDAKVFTGLFE